MCMRSAPYESSGPPRPMPNHYFPKDTDVNASLAYLDLNTLDGLHFLLASETFHPQKFFLHILSSYKQLSWAHFY